MPLSAQTITTLSRTIAEDYDSRLEVVSVAATHGGSDRVELLVSVTERNREPRMHMMNLTRTKSADFERDFRHRLQETLE